MTTVFAYGKRSSNRWMSECVSDQSVSSFHFFVCRQAVTLLFMLMNFPVVGHYVTENGSLSIWLFVLIEQGNSYIWPCLTHPSALSRFVRTATGWKFWDLQPLHNLRVWSWKGCLNPRLVVMCWRRQNGPWSFIDLFSFFCERKPTIKNSGNCFWVDMCTFLLLDTPFFFFS